ncbi:hypothetical protein [Brevibacterium aurantiacum]|uniref:Uncharacterized protein n=1 Tax=Brevibacterium aurantiacum TaxID=273384 RepID=A0A1D7W333_BREAU|nr:hypothetical protein [Brevibacterium aurantiacum]AOP53058.1 hypothetical protein BLSMQ_1348 [Brevibacterium aurantiacum]AZT92976.1 hypothetical protein CXR23_07325 [Brevibacterium aurantiacum]PCC50242.1 hypothetical protein CIK62_08985 [Brevibacterium aurantiacum]PCC52227.1 hypothetical protein CIK59_17665 [Brevibacterium aurantiacum]RCS99306.1 hypothetical protein CIK60_05520 [Brevibacterium aurantiacum]
MREQPGPGADRREEPSDQTTGAAQPAGVTEPALRLTPHITDAEALAVFARKLPGAQAEVRQVIHPFWRTVLSARTRGIFGRSRKKSLSSGAAGAGAGSGPGVGQRMNVLVNAYSGKGFIADFEPIGTPVDAAVWDAALEASDQAGPRPSLFEVSRTARSLVRTKVLKTVKLGMGITLDEAAPPRGILKPNWIVTGANEKFAATILVDGLDSSHYIVRVEKLEQD